MRRQVRFVLLAMSALTLAVAATAFFIAGSRAMLAALMGGLSQIAAVLVYGCVAHRKEVPHPHAVLALHVTAEVVKIIVALALMALGALGVKLLGAGMGWFVASVAVALAAYWLALVFT